MPIIAIKLHHKSRVWHKSIDAEPTRHHVLSMVRHGYLGKHFVANAFDPRRHASLLFLLHPCELFVPRGVGVAARD